MERFVRLIAAGGIALVLGIWILDFTEVSSRPWLLGVALVFLGVTGLVTGTSSEIRFDG